VKSEWFIQKDIDEVIVTKSNLGLNRLLKERISKDVDYVLIRSRKVANIARFIRSDGVGHLLSDFLLCFRSPTDIRLADACETSLSRLIGFDFLSDEDLRPGLSWGSSKLASTGKPIYDSSGRLNEALALNRVKWHTKYATRPLQTDAALIHFPWAFLEMKGVDSFPSELVLHHYRMSTMSQPSQDAAAICNSKETRNGQCGASGRAANSSCGFGWCCLVSCGSLKDWGNEA
jgi:hypothetical protein